MPTPTRSRAFTITLNNYSNEEYNNIIQKSKEHGSKWIFGKEIGEKEETPHIQGFIKFKHPRTLSATIKLYDNKRIHFEIAKGNDKQNYIYCSKDGEFEQHGFSQAEPKIDDTVKVIAINWGRADPMDPYYEYDENDNISKFYIMMM